SSSVHKAAKKMTDRDGCSSVVINDKVSKVLGLIPQRDIVRNIYQLIVYRTSVFYPLHLSSPSLIIPRMQRIYLLRLHVVGKEESNKP
ncbi:MAG: hypothetical protein WAZ77_19320, partial [Candidatus Nitrosopolaris sp.]